MAKGKATDNMNMALCRPFSEEEIHRALFVMGPNKALGPDGFHAAFFQKSWDLVKKKVVAMCLGILNNGESFAASNSLYCVNS